MVKLIELFTELVLGKLPDLLIKFGCFLLGHVDDVSLYGFHVHILLLVFLVTLLAFMVQYLSNRDPCDTIIPTMHPSHDIDLIAARLAGIEPAFLPGRGP